MNERECGDLLVQLQTRMRESGRGDLDQLLVDSRLTTAPSSRLALLAYLEGMRDDMRLQGRQLIAETANRLNRYRSNRPPLAGLVVDLRGPDELRQRGRVRRVDGESRFDEAAAQVEQLIALIREDSDLL